MTRIQYLLKFPKTFSVEVKIRVSRAKHEPESTTNHKPEARVDLESSLTVFLLLLFFEFHGHKKSYSEQFV